MNYPYSKTNRIKEPHNYMYTPFQGEFLLQAYRSSRMFALQNPAVAQPGYLEPDIMLLKSSLLTLENLFDASTPEGGKKFRSLLQDVHGKIFVHRPIENSSLVLLANSLETFHVQQSTTTLDLLHALIAVQTSKIQNSTTKLWLDCLIQRFEVTKKIYEFYPPGFRKGEGSNTSVRLYWLFALSLSLFYTESSQIKYLSTLLKICDLLCSLPGKVLNGHIPEHGLSTILAVEIISVQLLSEKKNEGCVCD